MDAARDQFTYLAKTTLELLRSFICANEIDVSRVVLWAEQYRPELRLWFDEIATTAKRDCPVSCRPWSTAPEITLASASAVETCTMLLAAVYQTLLPDRPLLVSVGGGVEKTVDRIDAYLTRHRNNILKRVQHVGESINPGEWLTLIATADLELLRLNQPGNNGGNPDDVTPVTAQRLCEHAGCGDRIIRDALTHCKRVTDGTGRAAHQWRYCDALQFLREIKTGLLKDVVWPDLASELTTKQDSSKIPAKSLNR